MTHPTTPNEEQAQVSESQRKAAEEIVMNLVCDDDEEGRARDSRTGWFKDYVEYVTKELQSARKRGADEVVRAVEEAYLSSGQTDDGAKMVEAARSAAEGYKKIGGEGK